MKGQKTIDFWSAEAHSTVGPNTVSNNTVSNNTVGSSNAHLLNEHLLNEHLLNEHLVIGETLPLFGDITPHTVHVRTATNDPLIRKDLIDERLADEQIADEHIADEHMEVALRLAKALKAAKRGHKSPRDPVTAKIARLTPSQRKRVGTSICEHLLASLRQQVRTEQELTRH